MLLLFINFLYGFLQTNSIVLGFPGEANGRELACHSGDKRRHQFDPWCQANPLEEGIAATPLFLPGESHGQKSLAAYAPWGHKESDMTDTTQHVCTAFRKNFSATIFLFTLLYIVTPLTRCFTLFEIQLKCFYI